MKTDTHEQTERALMLFIPQIPTMSQAGTEVGSQGLIPCILSWGQKPNKVCNYCFPGFTLIGG